ncbi:Metallo-dependent phosphatase-like protein [Diplogelasinospora grovesii]|uniref:Metallo-dependent phosphatase-like protein n=1 Tax=Diplogelasinospora grovesii TaxID=303347 RepID=A0AAN6S5C4_9PEZI|nr:Metallo-dependent phosphatase-like protein [Diplogelasinospora grovesii]
MDIKTRFLILFDTHAGQGLRVPDLPVDVAIRCGDLTDESKMHEFRASLELLRSINAPLKLVIAGNHDFTLDTPIFRKKAAEAESKFSIEPELVKGVYGDFGEAQQLFAGASDNIAYLEEGTHHFNLQNGAKLTVYVSPFTPSLEADWGFQFKRGEYHDFAIDKTADIVVTHGPPKGILDFTASGQRGGCEHLFAAVARARPRLHCFGHIHEGWGAKLVTWRGENASDDPSHFCDIDNGASVLVENLATLRPGKWDTAETVLEKEKRMQALKLDGYRGTSHCAGSDDPLKPGSQTLFVNAAVEALDEEDGAQLPWVVDIGLPAAAT